MCSCEFDLRDVHAEQCFASSARSLYVIDDHSPCVGNLGAGAPDDGAVFVAVSPRDAHCTDGRTFSLVTLSSDGACYLLSNGYYWSAFREGGDVLVRAACQEGCIHCAPPFGPQVLGACARGNTTLASLTMNDCSPDADTFVGVKIEAMMIVSVRSIHFYIFTFVSQ